MYHLDKGFKMSRTIEPDFASNCMIPKFNGEKQYKRTYLNPTQVNLLNILKTNNWKEQTFEVNRELQTEH